MAKSVHNDVLDAMLAEIATANIMNACSAEPTTRTEAVTTYSLADVAMTTGLGSGDYTAADGDSSGRKVTMTQKTGVTVDITGTATHVSLCDATVLLYVTTCTSQALTATNTMTFNSWKIEVADPT